MKPVEVLSLCRELCDNAGVPWYLGGATLLCANGLDDFPDYLTCAEIILSGDSDEDLRRIREQVLSRLPDNWTCSQDGTYVKQYKCDGQLMAEFTILPVCHDPRTITCGGITYPVRSDYREYLEETFGDYENGLHDDIGVGLTAEEKEALKAHQIKCREALVFVQALSEEYHLRYYLLAGSVLGAVRHGGFIPWDDDVDIGIRIEDLPRFEELVKAHLPAGFTFEQPAPNHPYPRMFSKICHDDRCCIDLWPLVPIPFDGFQAKFTWFFSKLITKIHYCKIGYPVEKHGKLAKICSLFLTDHMAMKLARWNEGKALGKAPAYINLYSVYRRQKETIPLTWLDTPATELFEGLEVPVVGCTHEYLTHLYGDYMARPAPWKRASRHFERFHTAK